MNARVQWNRMLASPSSINIPLLQSAALGDLPLLKKVLSEEGVDINTTDEVQNNKQREM